ncbi:MAG: hypothetical protein GY820_25460 [Gammaproteobacteria bacterium]|nr:hypothetical protein [Gammaproteobacteria bacterium]
MEFHGVATSKPLGEELRQNLANSPGSAVKSTRDDNTVFSVSTPISHEIGDRIRTRTPQTIKGCEAKPQQNFSLSGPSSIEVGAEIKTCTSQNLMGSERQLRENSVSSFSSTVKSMRNDTAVSSLSAPNSIELGENISTPTPQTSKGTVEQSRERWPQVNRYSQPPLQNRRGHYYDDRDWSTADRPRPPLKGKGSSKYQGCFCCNSPHHLARFCSYRQQHPSYSTPNRVPQSQQYADRSGPTHIAPQPQPFRPEEPDQPNERTKDFLSKMANANADMGRAIASMQSEIWGINSTVQLDTVEVISTMQAEINTLRQEVATLKQALAGQVLMPKPKPKSKPKPQPKRGKPCLKMTESASVHSDTNTKDVGQQITTSAPIKIRVHTKAKAALEKKSLRRKPVKSPILVLERTSFQKLGPQVECAKSCCADQGGSNQPEQVRRLNISLNASRRLHQLANDHDYGSRPLELAYILF